MKAPLARPLVRASLVFLAMVVLLAVFADLIACDGPLVAARAGDISILPARAAPNEGWDWAISAPLSPSDHVLARTVHAARSSVLVTVCVLAIALTFGIAIGAAAGFGPPIADAVLARSVELTGALPTLIVLAIVRSVESVHGIVSFIVVLATLRALLIARLVRGEMLRVGGQEFVTAARALGAARWRIALVHVLPHVMGPVLVAAAFTAASVVGLEAALSFVGLGLPSEVPSWGSLLAGARAASSGSAIVPALAIVTTTGACWLVADALDDALSARRGRSRT